MNVEHHGHPLKIALWIIIVVVFVIAGGFLGYSYGFLRGVEEGKKAAEASKAQAGGGASYTNPFANVPTNPFEAATNTATNPFEDVKLNPFAP